MVRSRGCRKILRSEVSYVTQQALPLANLTIVTLPLNSVSFDGLIPRLCVNGPQGRWLINSDRLRFRPPFRQMLFRLGAISFYLGLQVFEPLVKRLMPLSGAGKIFDQI